MASTFIPVEYDTGLAQNCLNVAKRKIPYPSPKSNRGQATHFIGLAILKHLPFIVLKDRYNTVT
jgi:hypothetical protein